MTEQDQDQPDPGRDIIDTGELAIPDDMPCPVVALGERNRTYFFIAASGEMKEYKDREFSRAAIEGLFGGRPKGTAWLRKNFPRVDKDGITVVDWAVTATTGWLMGQCAQAGLWSEKIPIRSIGVWPPGPGGKLPIVHCGRDVWVDKEWRPAGFRLGAALYVATSAIEQPAKASATARDVEALRDALNLWRFQLDLLGPKLVLGYLGQALLGAAPSWHVHILLTGSRGCGKSTLMKLLRAAIGDQGSYRNSFSEAGIRQDLSGEARAVGLDEAEGKTVGHVQQVIELLRLMSDEDGAVGVRGAPGGTARNFQTAGTAYLAAINAPQLSPQDRSRIFVFEMLDLALGKAGRAGKIKTRKAIEAAAEMSPGLRARAIRGWPRYLKNLEIYSDQLMDMGCDTRQADQIGALLAGAEMMLRDKAVDPEDARRDVEGLQDLIDELIAEDNEGSDARQCLGLLMTRHIDHWQAGAKQTIGTTMVHGYANVPSIEALKAYGLRLAREGAGSPWWLYIANRHSGLSGVFEGSRWADGGWRTSLLRLDGAEAYGTVSFGGYKSRCIRIPVQHLPRPPRPRAGDVVPYGSTLKDDEDEDG